MFLTFLIHFNAFPLAFFNSLTLRQLPPSPFLKHALILDSLWDLNVPNQQKLLALWFFYQK